MERVRCVCEFPGRLLLPASCVSSCSKCEDAKEREAEERRRERERIEEVIRLERKRCRTLQKNTIDKKMKRVEEAFVLAAEVEGLSYLQAIRLCDQMRGRLKECREEK